MSSPALESDYQVVRRLLQRVLDKWVNKTMPFLESADWHKHQDINEDVLVLVTKDRMVLRLTITPMLLTRFETNKRDWQKKIPK